MFGYATNETPECMPLTLMLAHRLVRKLAELRRNGALPWLRPDCKSQVTIEYQIVDGATVPVRVHTVVISAQHAEHVELMDMRSSILEKVVKTVIPSQLLDEKTIYHIQPTGKFVIGGPQVNWQHGHGATGMTLVLRAMLALRGARSSWTLTAAGARMAAVHFLARTGAK